MTTPRTPQQPPAIPEQAFKILVVCTANRCRSPLAELLLRHYLHQARVDGIEVTSAGTHAIGGQPIDPPMAAAAVERGADPAGFASTRLTDAMIQASSLVLTATREQRSMVLERVPLALRRTFTLREFPAAAALALQQGPVASLAALAKASAAARGRLDQAELDVADPIGGSPEQYAQAVTEIDGAARSIAQSLGQGITHRD